MKDLRSSNVKDLDRVAAATGAELIPAELGDRDVALTSQQVADLGGGGGGGGGWIYGDGSDGALTLHDGDAWVPGFYTDVTIEAGATVHVSSFASGWPIFRCTGTFTIDGTLDLRGNDAAGRQQGSSVLPGFQIGDGATGTQDQGGQPIGATLADAVSSQGTPVGGAGGNGLDDNAFAGGTKVPLGYPRSLGPRSGNLTTGVSVNIALGGSAGGGDGTNYGGAGGGGGAWALIIARHIVHGVNNLYLLNGGKGGDGGDDGSGTTGNGDCGGGGGGGAGYWITLSDTVDAVSAYITTVGNTDPAGTGGLGGAGCGVGLDGDDGDDGFVIHLLNT